VIKTQWACNHFSYRKLGLPLAHDVTFIGQPHGNRRAIIHALRAAGIDVQTWGNGWERGRCSQEEMIRIFNQSRINLNLSNAAPAVGTPLQRWRGWLRGRLSRSLDLLPGGRHVKALVRRCRGAAPAVQPADPVALEQLGAGQFQQQIKGRNFEVPGCGGFLLTALAEDLESYYVPGAEIATFRTLSELIEQIRYFLDQETARAAIAEAGYQRTLQEHTYARRFAELFARMGLPAAPAPAKPGTTVEVTE